MSTHHKRLAGVAAVVALACAAVSPSAWALSMGRIAVQSSLGEPLRAEIDIADLTPEEAASLKVTLASPDVFRAAGLEYNAGLLGIRMSLQTGQAGRAKLLLASERAFNDPFVDLVLVANWFSGRITREYTVLLDPPRSRVAQQSPLPITQPALTQPAFPAPAEVSPVRPTLPLPPPAPPPVREIGIASLPAVAAPERRRPAVEPLLTAPAPTLAPAPAPAVAPPVNRVTSPVGRKVVVVKRGDTAGRIAAVNKPASVSLEQMLLAMLNANPQAFDGGNVNRIRSGAVLQMPTEEQLAETSDAQSRRAMVAQSRDFRQFRDRLARNAQAVATATPGREASGQLQARVDETKATPSTPDKLTLSKGSVAATDNKSGAEKIAREREATEATTRVAELTKNLEDLAKIGANTSGSRNSPQAAGGTPTVNLPAPTTNTAPQGGSPQAAAKPMAAASSPVAGPALTTTIAAAPDLTASKPPTSAVSPAAPSAKTPATAAAVTPRSIPVATPSLIDELLAHPYLVPVAGGLILLLLLLALARARKRRTMTGSMGTFNDSRFAESVYGSSAGARVGGKDSAAPSSIMGYSPSQLDAAGDVDAVEEADVYLAYGRDLQAEEILKEALHNNPGRVAIHVKLLEIYAKRNDLKSFEAHVGQAFVLTGGSGPEWTRVCELGQVIDPKNSLYRSTAVTTPGMAPPATPVAADTRPAPLVASAASVPTKGPIEFVLPDPPADDSKTKTPPLEAVTAVTRREPTLDIDPLPSIEPAIAATSASPAAAVAIPAVAVSQSESMRTLPDLPIPAAAAPTPATANGMIEFDLGDLGLDLTPDPLVVDTTDPAASNAQDRFDIKLELAQEFLALEDADGARALVEEVLAEATGPVRNRALQMLAKIR